MLIVLLTGLVFAPLLASATGSPAVTVSADNDAEVAVNFHFWLKRSVTQSEPVEEQIGGIIIIDGNYQEVADFIRGHRKSAQSELLFYKELNIESSVSLLNVAEAIVGKQLQTASDSTLIQYGLFLGHQLGQIGVDGCLVQESKYLGNDRHDVFFSGIQQAGISVLHEMPHGTALQQGASVKPLKPRKQFESFAAKKEMSVLKLDHTTDWMEDWLQNDILIIDDEQLDAMNYFSRKVNGNKWYRKIARQKETKRINWLKEYGNSAKLVAKPVWNKLQREFARESFVILNRPGSLPFRSLEDRYVLLGDEQIGALSQSMQRYAPVSFFTWERFDDAPEEVFTELLNTEHLIVDYRDMEDIERIDRMIEKEIKLTILVDDSTSLEPLLSQGTVVYRSSDGEQQQDLAGQILFGGVGAGGYVPFALGDQLQAGAAIRTEGGSRLAYDAPERKGIDPGVLLKIDSIVSESIREGAFPGCQIAIVKDHALVYNRSFGYFTYDSIFQVESSHLYDIASVTKVAATLQAVMFLQEQGLISLDEKLVTYLPALKESNKADLTIRNILMHEAGLRPWLPFYQVTLEKDLLSPYVYQSATDSAANRKTFGLYYPTPRQKEAVWQEIIDSDLRKLKKGDSTYNYRYSDLGFMFLQMLVETVSHQPLDEFLDQHVYQPLGLQKTLFNPLTKYQKEVIAPTEYDYYFRNAQVWGTVHDQNAQVLGGVAGHAGLFSNAHELAKLMLMNLNGGIYGGYKFLHNATMQHFTRQQKTGNRRGLGWDKPDLTQSNTSSQASALTYGHTGFTGTAVWVDPQYDLIYVFLSNRVYPSAENKKLIQNNIRSKIQDVIYQAMVSDF